MADNKKSKKTSNTSKKTVDAYAPTLRLVYRNEIVPNLLKVFIYSNKMEVPRLKSISVNMGIGDAKDNPKKLESAIQELTLITGQKPLTTFSKKDIQILRFVKDFLLVVKLLCVAIGCMILWKD